METLNYEDVFTEPRVTLIASTTLHSMPESVVGTPFFNRLNDAAIQESDADALSEFAGRSCYQSWEMPNPKTATSAGYVANIIEQQHFSVLEHGSATFYIEGVSRSLTHELIRHRHLSYSELSQRYVDMKDAKAVIPPALANTQGEAVLASEVTFDKGIYDALVADLIADGYPRKRAREAARAVLPSAMETKIVVTGNHRAWRDMLHKRWHVAADAEIRMVAGLILEDLRLIAPAIYADIPTEPFGTEPKPEPVLDPVLFN